MGTHTEKWVWSLGIFALGLGLVFWFYAVRPTPLETPFLQAQALREKKALALLKTLKEETPDGQKELLKDLPEKIRQTSSLVIEDPEFIGRNEQQKIWKIRAARAAQPQEDGLIYLQNLVAVSLQGDGAEMQVKAATGLLDDAQDLLLLTEGFSGTVYGYDATGQEATYHLKKQHMEGKALKVLGGRGRMDAQTFFADFHQEKAQFKGAVHLQLTLDKSLKFLRKKEGE